MVPDRDMVTMDNYITENHTLMNTYTSIPRVVNDFVSSSKLLL